MSVIVRRCLQNITCDRLHGPAPHPWGFEDSDTTCVCDGGQTIRDLTVFAEGLTALEETHGLNLSLHRLHLIRHFLDGSWAGVRAYANESAEAALRIEFPASAAAWLAVATWAYGNGLGLPTTVIVPAVTPPSGQMWQQVTLLIAYDPRFEDPPALWTWTAGIDSRDGISVVAADRPVRLAIEEVQP